jgi:hypothetical protein
LEVGEFGFEFGAGGDGALGGDPGAELAAVGAGGEVGGGLGGGGGFGAAFDDGLALEGLAAMSRALRLS